MLVFALLVILIFNFALDLDPKTRGSVTSGVLWVTFAFAGTLGLNRSMAMEKDRGCLDGLLLTPVDRSAIYFGKAIGNLVFMLLVEAIVLPVYTHLILGQPVKPWPGAGDLDRFDRLRCRGYPAGDHGGAHPHTRYPVTYPALPVSYPGIDRRS